MGKNGKLFFTLPVSMGEKSINETVFNKVREMNGYTPMTEIKFYNKEFDNFSEAERFIVENDYGVMCNMAVIVKSKCEKTAAHINLEKRLSNIKEQLEEMEKPHCSTMTAKLITCRTCESKIAKKYIKTNYCPVCNNDMRTKSLIDKNNKLINEYEKVGLKLSKMQEIYQKKLSKEPEKVYLIKAES